MKSEESAAYVDRCFNGEPASCSLACPFGLDIRPFMEKLQKGRWLPAYKAYRNAVVFPAVVSALCPQPCREHCQRTSVGDEAIALRDLEAACVRLSKTRKPEAYSIPPKPQSLAVIGAGMAGLSCALNLSQKKYRVTVFDKAPGWGGGLRSHPQFDIFDSDIALQFSVVDAQFRFNTEIKSLDELSGYDAIYIATGEGGDAFGLEDSWNPELMSTSAKGVFMGGGVCGIGLMESIASGNELSKILETYLQTGRTEKPLDATKKTYCEHLLKHDPATKKPRVVPASPDGYTDLEAKEEAARCYMCDCDACEASCEMLKYYRKKPHKIGLEAYSDTQTNVAFNSRTLTRETYSCNICGHCKSVCPVDVDIGALLQYTRQDRMGTGTAPVALHDYWLREMDFNTGEASFAAPPAGKETAEYAFFPGCQLGAANPDYPLKAYAYLASKADTGIILGCCGAPAYWAGDEKRFSDNKEKIRSAWENMGRPTLVFACAYCEKIFSEFMPDIKGVSLYELMARDEVLTPARPFDEAAVFDPCAARDDEGMQKGVRELALRSGARLEELKEPFRCCGNGGHIRLANRDLYEEIAAHRAEASPLPYVVYCVNCREIFKLRDKKCAHILDAVFSLDPNRRVPSLQEKRDNSLEVKKTLMKNLTGADFAPETHEWDGVNLVIGDELLSEMDRKLITRDDLREAIWQAEKSGEKFYTDGGDFQCRMIKSVLTYWVRYRVTAPDTYEILSAYSHRMRFSEKD